MAVYVPLIHSPDYMCICKQHIAKDANGPLAKQ